MKPVLCILALALLLGACSVQTTGNVVAEEPIKVCAILPLSGEFTVFGQDLQYGLEIAAENMNIVGGINGRPIKVIVEDNAYVPQRSVTAAMKLVEVNDCPVIIAPVIETAKPILSYAEEKGVPVFLTLDNLAEVTENPFLFSIGYDIDTAAEKLARFALQRGAESSVIIYDPVEFTQLSGEAYVREYEKHGGRVVWHEQLAFGDDLRTVASKITDLQPDAVYFAMAINDQTALVKRLHELGYEGMLFGPNSFLDDFIAAAGTAAEGACKTDLAPADPVVAERMLTQYRERYGRDPISLKYALLSRDATIALVEAARNVENGVDWPEALASVEMTTAFGEQITMADGGRAHRVESIYCVEDGEIVLVER